MSLLEGSIPTERPLTMCGYDLTMRDFVRVFDWRRAQMGAGYGGKGMCVRTTHDVDAADVAKMLKQSFQIESGRRT